METCNWDAQLWLCLYAEARQWQTGIGAFLGFLALMAAALLNFSLNRRRDRQLRRDEMVSVAAALYGEMLLLRKELALLVRAIRRGEQQPLFQAEVELPIYIPSQPLIYPALAHKLGLLPSELVLGITRFYDHCEGARKGLQNYQHLRTWGPVQPNELILEDAVGGVESVKPVLRMIEHLASIPKAEGRPKE